MLRPESLSQSFISPPFARRYFAEGWYIVTYALGIYMLNLVIGFLTPLVRAQVILLASPSILFLFFVHRIVTPRRTCLWKLSSTVLLLSHPPLPPPHTHVARRVTHQRKRRVPSLPAPPPGGEVLVIPCDALALKCACARRVTLLCAAGTPWSGAPSSPFA